MTQHVNRRSSAFIALVTLTILIVGAFFIAKAVESKGVEDKVEKTTVLAEQWFEYQGPESSDPEYEEAILNPSNYAPMSVPSCTTGTELCSIFAENDDGHPSESSLEELKNQILKNEPQNTSQVRFEN